MFALSPCTKFIALISGDERLSRSSLHAGKCHFSVIVYDSFLHLWLNNEGWQLERALGVGIKGLRFPLGRDESEWVCSEQTGSRCWSLCCHAYCCYHTTGSFCQPAERRAQKHDRRLSWWEPEMEAPLQIKEFQLATLAEPGAAVYCFSACCDLSDPLFVSLSPLCLPSSFTLCLLCRLCMRAGWWWHKIELLTCERAF